MATKEEDKKMQSAGDAGVQTQGEQRGIAVPNGVTTIGSEQTYTPEQLKEEEENPRGGVATGDGLGPQEFKLDKSVVTTTTTPTTPKTDGHDYWKEMYDHLKAEQLRYGVNQADLDKERRKQRTHAIIAAAGDVSSALANLIFTGKGAPNMYDPKEGLSVKMQERFDKAKAERKQREAMYHKLGEQKINMLMQKLARDQQALQHKESLAETIRYHNEALQNAAEANAEKVRHNKAVEPFMKMNAESTVRNSEAAIIRANKKGGSTKEPKEKMTITDPTTGETYETSNAKNYEQIVIKIHGHIGANPKAVTATTDATTGFKKTTERDKTIKDMVRDIEAYTQRYGVKGQGKASGKGGTRRTADLGI